MASTPSLAALREQIRRFSHADEVTCVEALLAADTLDVAQRHAITARAGELVHRCRDQQQERPLVDAFLQEFGLTNREGVALMNLAEALLRVPDAATAALLVEEKLHGADWQRHRGHSPAWQVNASALGLSWCERLLPLAGAAHGGILQHLLERLGEPLAVTAIRQAMGVLGNQYVLGQTLTAALARSRKHYPAGTRFSFDMLGEGARTATQAQQYLAAYRAAIATLAQHSAGVTTPEDARTRPGISIKLSALHPRYRANQQQRVMAELLPALLGLAQQARQHNIDLSIDAEEAERLELSLDIFDALLRAPELRAWNGLGLVVQAYQKRATAVIAWLTATAQELQRQIPVRLVKGAYWDSEIKQAQLLGLSDYPVFTRKLHTDLSYQVCARQLFNAGALLFPQFATHNAHTVSLIQILSAGRPCELQRLHGMGDMLYRVLIQSGNTLPVRVYAPVGAHRDLLPYLVRRLLENSANSSFINRFLDPATEVRTLVSDPQQAIRRAPVRRHAQIPRPPELLSHPAQPHPQPRANARGLDLNNPLERAALLAAMAAASPETRAASAVPVTPDESLHARIDSAFNRARAAQPDWDAQGGSARADILEHMADLLEQQLPLLMATLGREAGRTLPDSLAEVREAVDFCRYYALLARQQCAGPLTLPAPTGEANQLSLHGRGVFVCISPWNFPLAIFTGQIAAALAAGNTVLAKPAEQTPQIAAICTELFYQAGVPAAVLQLLPGSGAQLGPLLLAHPALAGVAFTGSTATAHTINRQLAARSGAIVPLIAETGGINAMLADSTTLPEQLLDDVLASAFNSAGQRCSALRLLCVQEDIADGVIALLREAIAELKLGDPLQFSTDIGPVIDAAAHQRLYQYVQQMRARGRVLAEYPAAQMPATGTFFPPTVLALEQLEELTQEVFGPVLHVLRYPAGGETAVLDAINASGYGLTFGLHTRLQHKAGALAQRSRAGNVYINRGMTGAVVGMQPFGGQGLSGTGPKAGGPHYLLRFASEKSVSTNTAASGGNVDLLGLED